MNNLINVKQNNNGEIIVSGRELHEFLEIGTRYDTWFERMKEYGFVENTDFALVAQKRATNNPKNPTTEIQDHAIKLDMAKEISMIQRNEKGKQARQYFIQVEKTYNNPLQAYLSLDEEDRGIAYFKELKEKKILQLESIEKDKLLLIAAEKNIITDKFLNEDSLYSIDTVSKVLAIKELGRNNFYKYLREEKILMTDTYMDYKGNTKGGLQHFTAYAQYTNTQCYFKHRTRDTQIGRVIAKQNVAMFTPKGIEWIIKRLQKGDYIKIKTLEEIVAELRDVKEVA